MSRPDVSVVIPTRERPASLARAIESALASAGTHRIQVVVVPNGPDRSWSTVRERFIGNADVVWHAIDTPHANAARNAGLKLVEAPIVRFLDDDDYLIPDAARRQLVAMIDAGATLCSGSVLRVDDAGRRLGELAQPDAEDALAAMLCRGRQTQPASHLVTTAAAHTTQWDETLDIRQDTDWFIRMTAVARPAWLRFNEPVAAWTQHQGPRISAGRLRAPGGDALRHTAELIVRAIEELKAEGGAHDFHLRAASDGLWSSFQKGYRYNPSYWRQVAATAEGLHPGQRPPSLIYKIPVVRSLDPVMIETLLTPLRYVHHAVQRRLHMLSLRASG